MIFKTNTVNIKFWSTLPGLEKIESVKRATEYMPEWFKNMPAYTGMAEPKFVGAYRMWQNKFKDG